VKRTGLLVAAAAWLAAPALGADVEHRFSEPSSVAVVVSGGVTEIALRNVVHVPFETWSEAAGAMQPRLATLTSSLVRRNDREGIEPGSAVTATIWDLTPPVPALLARIDAPGSVPAVQAQRYLSITEPGCCGSPDVNRVFVLETGRFLFRSTGVAPRTAAAWMEVSGSGPQTIRWAAFDASIQKSNLPASEGRGAGLLGRLVYGSDAGPIASMTLIAKGDPAGIAVDLLESARIGWQVDGKDYDPGYGPPDRAMPLPLTEGTPAANRISGVSILLMVEDEIVLTLPVTADRPDLGRVHLDAGLQILPSYLPGPTP
jgi:hypothetical protein